MRSLQTTLVVLVAPLSLAACTMQRADVPFPDANELIAHIEQKIVFPAGAGPLEGYTRTYSRHDPLRGPERDGYVYGVLERIGDGPRTARWVEEPPPPPADGGCAVVTLRYSIASDAIEDIRCNGEA